jgi:hypothetical protein
LSQDGDARVRVPPQRKEILIGGERFGTIGASYAGDNTFEASAGKVVQVVKK